MKPARWPFAGILLAALVCGIGVLAQAQGPAISPLPELPKPDFTALPTARVLQVVDGDTVNVDLGGQETTCRLIGGRCIMDVINYDTH